MNIKLESESDGYAVVGARYALLQPDTTAKPARPMSNTVTP